MKAMALRQTLLIVLAVLSQGILAVHDAQHIDAQPSTCTVCQAHLPPITGEPSGLLALTTAAAIQPAAVRSVRIAHPERPYSTFRSRAPPENLT